MSTREFIALGTASQVPTRKRNHNGYFLRWDNEGILFDPGEGTQRQMIYSGIAAGDITKIFITHFHGDHCLGLPGILQRLSLDRVTHPVEVYFPATGEKYFRNLKEASIYYETANIEPIMIELEGVLYSNGKITVSTMKLDHTVDSWGYRIDENDSVMINKDKIRALGLSGPAIGELKSKGEISQDGRTIKVEEVSSVKKGQSLAFIMDTRICESASKLANNVEILVAESTFMQEHQEEATNHGHMTTIDAAKLADSSNAKLLVLTHFSQRYGEDADFVGEARKGFKNVIAMNDGDKLDIRKSSIVW